MKEPKEPFLTPGLVIAFGLFMIMNTWMAFYLEQYEMLYITAGGVALAGINFAGHKLKDAGMHKDQAAGAALYWIYAFGSFATFAYLTAMDSGDFNAWNWLFIIPINMFLGTIWPIYWGLLHWVM